jgi:hypothetical protein
MPDKFESIPSQGEHRPEIDDEPVASNVRAAESQDAVRDEAPPRPVFQILHSGSRGAYRLRKCASRDVPPGADFSELGCYESRDEVTSAFGQLPDHPRFVVLENTETGAVFYDRDANLSDDWVGEGEFDQVTLFHDESAAAEYVGARQDAARRGNS